MKRTASKALAHLYWQESKKDYKTAQKLITSDAEKAVSFAMQANLNCLSALLVAQKKLQLPVHSLTALVQLLDDFDPAYTQALEKICIELDALPLRLDFQLSGVNAVSQEEAEVFLEKSLFLRAKVKQCLLEKPIYKPRGLRFSLELLLTRLKRFL